jgi:hypothetical protein
LRCRPDCKSGRASATASYSLGRAAQGAHAERFRDAAAPWLGSYRHRDAERGERNQQHHLAQRRLDPGHPRPPAGRIRNGDRGSRLSTRLHAAGPGSPSGDTARATPFERTRDHPVSGLPIRPELRCERRGQLTLVVWSEDAKQVDDGAIHYGALTCEHLRSTTIAGKDQQHRIVFPFERPREPRGDGRDPPQRRIEGEGDQGSQHAHASPYRFRFRCTVERLEGRAARGDAEDPGAQGLQTQSQ